MELIIKRNKSNDKGMILSMIYNGFENEIEKLEVNDFLVKDFEKNDG